MADPQEEATCARAPPSPIARDAAHASPRILPGDRCQYPLNVAVDFTRLQADALRKYMAFHGIPEVPGSSREQLAVTVARHFNQECKKADETSSITSFVTYLTGTNDIAEATKLAKSRRPKLSTYLDKENDSRQPFVNGEDAALGEEDVDDLYDDAREAFTSLWSESRPFVVKKRRPVTMLNNQKRSRGRSSGDAGEAGVTQKKKKRKGRSYCICKGASFGNMIACDNKKCLDRSNWYHMSCVDLDSSKDPPETWYCPSCQENDTSDIPENQYRKPVASVTYGDMISHALTVMPGGKGSFKEICDFVETEYESHLNWKLESDQRKSPVWKSSVRKILFSNVRFRKHPEAKGMFCLAA